MVKIPEPENTTIKEIYRSHERQADDGFRAHLGASLIGQNCERALWYTFRWCTPADHSGQLLRLFQTGELEEDRMVAELRATGATVYAVDDRTGQQFTINAVQGHFGGSMDGAAIGLIEAPQKWHVLEFKTHNAKSFAELKKKGVQAAKPQHYAQMQIYMGETGMQRAFYLAKNKDNDELYAERVRYDASEHKRLIAKAERIIWASEPLDKISQDPAWYECKFCDHRQVCHGTEAPAVNCRTCAHSSPASEGPDWYCHFHEKPLTPDEQRQGCDHHIYHPTLLQNFARPVDSDGRNAVDYENVAAGGKVFFRNGPDGYASREIRACTDKRALGQEDVDQLREQFDAEVTG